MNEPPDLCMFDLYYICDRDCSILSPEYDNLEHLKTENGINNKGQSVGWHPLLDQTLFGNQVIGLRHWIDNSKYSGRYGWGYHSSEEEDQTEEDK